MTDPVVIKKLNSIKKDVISLRGRLARALLLLETLFRAMDPDLLDEVYKKYESQLPPQSKSGKQPEKTA